MSTDPTPSFDQLGLAAPLLQAINELGYEAPTPIQARSIPPLLAGRDLLGQARTGTGKTAAFTLPMLHRLDPSIPEAQVLVLTPTRELAIQVAEAAQGYGQHLRGLRMAVLYGGQSFGGQVRDLRRGPQFIVGTPGRVLDHLTRGTLALGRLSGFVLDEADEMLQMGFLEDMEAILAHTPDTKQVALFSATMPADIERIARQSLHDPVRIQIESDTATVPTIRQRYWLIGGLHKLDALDRILEVEPTDGVLIFARTKLSTAELAGQLELRGYACAALHGDMSQESREHTVERLRAGAIDIVVATDVAARGLDVKRVSHVINYDMPFNAETYIHRIGRTARAGASGEAILFVSHRQQRLLRIIEEATRQPISPMKLPGRAALAAGRKANLEARLDAVFATPELDLGPLKAAVTHYARDRDLTPEQVAAALVHIVQGNRPLQPTEKDIEEEAFATRGGRRERGRDRDAPRSRPDSLVPYRVDIGHEHGLEPRHLVGALANETGLTGRDIGQIRIFDTFTVIHLPDGMPPEVSQHLDHVWVCGQRLRLRPVDGAAPVAPRPRRGGPRGGDGPGRPSKPGKGPKGSPRGPGGPGKPGKGPGKSDGGKRPPKSSRRK